MSEIKTVDVLTSGGDCAGLNAIVVVAESVKTEEGENASVSYAGDLRQRYVGIGYDLMRRLAPHGDVDIRVTILDPVQRGGGPRAIDPNDPLIHTARGLGIPLGEQRAHPGN